MKKYGVILSLCLMICVLFSGCGQVTQLTTIYADGSRAYSYNISLDSTVLTEYGIDEARAWEVIDENTQSYWSAFSSGRMLNGVTFDSGKTTTSPFVYKISLSFASFESYCNFFGTSASVIAKQPADIREGLFSSQNVIADSKISDTNELLVELNLIPSLVLQITQNFADEFFGGDLSRTTELFSKIKTNIIRAYPASLKVKTNAKETTSFWGAKSVVSDTADTLYTAHLWQCTLAEPTTDIFVYRTVYTSANRTAWYILGIGLALIFGAVLFVIFYFKHKKDELNKVENIKETTATPFVEKNESENQVGEVVFENAKNTENYEEKLIEKIIDNENKADKIAPENSKPDDEENDENKNKE